MRPTKHLPNFITCLNLFCGCVGIIVLFQFSPVWAAYFIWLAAILDFFDGFFARMLKAYSPMGKELDSLADMVSFGVLPSLIIFIMVGEETEVPFLQYIALLIAVFSALRLANFNIDQRQTESFIGLPTPANAIFISSLPIIAANEYIFISNFLLNEWVLTCIVVVFSILLVAEIPLFSLKFKSYSWSNNKLRFVFLVTSIILLLLFKIIAAPLIIILYIFISIVENIFLRRKLTQK